MEQTAAPPPQPPPLTTVTTTTESCEDQTTNSTKAAPPSQKLRLMCSYGGHIVPRPHDKTLCYVGGETRIVVVDRHSTLSNLTNRLAKTLTRSPPNTTSFLFTLKYQLPSEDLDSLISVTTDEDLENMIEEYERLNNDLNSNRLRLFLFPVQPEPVSVSSIGSLLESSTKSEDWFLNALNGTSTTSAFSDASSSVNCLLGLDDDVLIPEQVNNKSSKDLAVVSNKSLVHDVQSVPDSPMLETNSSFGSASSSPSLSNLPPIRVDDQPPVIVGVPVGSKGVINQPQPQQQQYRFDMTSPDSASSDGSVTNPLSRWNVIKPGVVYQDPVLQTQFSNTSSSNNSNISEQSNRIQMQPPSQPQFMHTAVPPPQYIHHHPSGAVPVGSYYQMYTPQTQVQHPPLDQHNFVYYMPATARHPPGPTQGYSLPLQTDVSPAASAPPSSQVPPPSSLFTAPPRAVQAVTKPETPVGVYRTVTSGAPAPQLVHVPSSQHQLQPPYVGYSHVHQPALPVASGGGGSGGNYAYEFTDPSKGQHIYYAAQPLPPQSVAQYQTMTATLPVEAQAGSHVQTDNSVKQQVRTSQP